MYKKEFCRITLFLLISLKLVFKVRHHFDTTAPKASVKYDKGILLSSGEICENKINDIWYNLLRLLKLYGYSRRKMLRLWKEITSTLNHLYSKVLEFEMMVVLHILFDTLVLKFWMMLNS